MQRKPDDEQANVDAAKKPKTGEVETTEAAMQQAAVANQDLESVVNGCGDAVNGTAEVNGCDENMDVGGLPEIKVSKFVALKL